MEASKNLPGARGSVFPKYQSMPIHGDPIQPISRPHFKNIYQQGYVKNQNLRISILKISLPIMPPIQTHTIERNLINVFKNPQSIST